MLHTFLQESNFHSKLLGSNPTVSCMKSLEFNDCHSQSCSVIHPYIFAVYVSGFNLSASRSKIALIYLTCTATLELCHKNVPIIVFKFSSQIVLKLVFISKCNSVATVKIFQFELESAARSFLAGRCQVSGVLSFVCSWAH